MLVLNSQRVLRAHVELRVVGGHVEVRSIREPVEAERVEDLKIASVATVLLWAGKKT